MSPLFAFGLTEGLVLLVVLAAAFAIFNWRSFRQTLGAGRAQLGKVGRTAEGADPMAMFQQEIEDGLEAVAEASENHAESAALVKSIERQVNDGQREKQQLENRIKLALEKGDPNNTAKSNALALASVEQNLARNQEQLDRVKTQHNNFTKQIQKGQSSIQSTRQRAKNLGIELKQSEREAKLAEYSKKFTYDPSAVNSKVAEYEEAVRQRIDANRAKAESSAELSSQGLANQADDELAQEADAEAILARFRTDSTSTPTT